jgi:SAM-dependent methyltransferase
MTTPAKPIIPDFGRVAASWRKWEEWLRPCYESFNQILLSTAAIHDGHRVLDLGCGSGSITFLEAGLVGQNGKVIGIDISSEMIGIARGGARENGITNIEFQNQDVESLSFPDESFDSVTARFCLMFLKSPENVLRAIRRVIKTGGTFAACVWGPAEKNPLPASVLKLYVNLPDVNHELPGPFRFGAPGALLGMMRTAGFQKTLEREVFVHEIFTTGDQYVTHLLESSGTWGGLLLSLGQAQFQEAMKSLVETAEQYRIGDHLEIPRCALIVSGAK